ncbi:hypothetical protein [Trichothermofontia sichuanensis]|uniref:hypothetical protein n=1 Tax=Trichothermofontia sichuanensis TaxID=3045816 RepID=UPI00249DEAF2
MCLRACAYVTPVSCYGARWPFTPVAFTGYGHGVEGGSGSGGPRSGNSARHDGCDRPLRATAFAGGRGADGLVDAEVLAAGVGKAAVGDRAG